MSPEDTGSRIFWNGRWNWQSKNSHLFTFESTILSELDLPPSGLYQLQDSVPMPFGNEESQKQEQASETECQFVLLANIALRRLLNRAYRSMSSPSMSN